MNIKCLNDHGGMNIMFSSKNRDEVFAQLKSESLDVLVIGGGITGAGIALDAVTRGMRVGLIDMQDFAAGTSSRSTKLIHGGLRYLKQLDFKVVSEVGKEREIVYENGPHVTSPEWMMLPFYKAGTFGPLMTNVGLLMYDFLAGVKKDERRVMLSREETMKKAPLIKKDGLKGAGYYVEYKTDDARLTIEVLKKAVEHGAYAINYAKCTHLLYDDANTISGVKVTDQITGITHCIEAKKIINATGPWVDQLREMDRSKHGKSLYLTKGVHLVFSQKDFPLSQAIYFDAHDGRMVFAIPRGEQTYVGTTDTTYTGDIKHPTTSEEDVLYLLKAVNSMFPSLSLTKQHVQSSYAGIRPLIAEEGKDPSEISRKDEIFISTSGLISITGGKLTGYRKMAENVVDVVAKQFKREDGILYSSSQTKYLSIAGGEVGGSKNFESFQRGMINKGLAYGLSEKDTTSLVKRYGTNIEKIFVLYDESRNEAVEENIDLLVLAELKYGIQHECVYKPVDFFIRRTGALFFNIDWVYKHKHDVIRYMKKYLRWTEKQMKQYIDELDTCIKEATLA